MTQTTSKVSQLTQALRGDLPASFENTGGGCHAIVIDLGDSTRNDYTQVLITGDDVFYASDWDGDDDLDGAWTIGAYDAAGELIASKTLREDPAADWPWTMGVIVALAAEMAALTVCRFCGEGSCAEAGPVIDGFHRDANCRIHHESDHA